MKHEITSLSFAGGLNIKADPKSIKENQTTQADNVTYYTAGIVRKREGHSYLGRTVNSGKVHGSILVDETSLVVTSASAIANVNGEICYTDNRYFYTYSEATDEWTRRGDVSEISIDKTNSLVSNLKQLFTTSNLINMNYADIGEVRCVVANVDNYVLASTDVGSTISGAVIGFWDLFKNEWIMPPISPKQQNLATFNPSLPCVVAHQNTFRISVLSPEVANPTTGVAKLYTACINQTQILAGFNYKSGLGTAFTFTGVTVPCYGFRDNAAPANSSYGKTLDFTHGVDMATARGVSTGLCFAVVTGPASTAASPSTGASLGLLAVVGTTGPCLNKIIIWNSPTAVTPITQTTGATTINGRAHIAANADTALVTGFGGSTAQGVALPATTGAIALSYTSFPLYNIANSDFAYALPGLNNFGQGIVLVKQGLISTTSPTPPLFAESPGYVTIDFIAGGVFVTPGTTSNYPWTGFGDKVSPISKPISQDENELNPATSKSWYCWARNSGPIDGLQQSNLLLDLTRFKVRSRVAFNEAKPSIRLGTTYLPEMTFMETQPTVLGAMMFAGNGSGIFEADGRIVDEDNQGEVDITGRGQRRIIPLDVGAFITGSRPSYYDGVTVRELGFDNFPEFNVGSVVVTAGIGGNLGHTSVQDIYYYTGIYRYFDNAGKLVMSASFPTVITATTALFTTTQFISFYMKSPLKFMTDTFPNGNFNSSDPNGFVATYTAVVYRTTADDALNFRELGLFTTTASVTGAAGFNLFVDNTSDADLRSTGLPFLYSSPVGGELDNFPPPACEIAIASQQRLFVVSSENPNRVYYTKPFASTRAPEFTSFFIEVDPNSGPITGLGVIDANLVVFKEKVIYVITGPGPDATGNGNFNDPVVLWSDDGCINSRSVLVTAQGIFYQSRRGIQLINRSQTNEYVGALVEDFTFGNLVSSALIVPQKSQVHFFMEDGTVLVYDYLLQLWSRFTSETPFLVNSSTLRSDRPVFLEHNRGMILQQVPNFYQDAVNESFEFEPIVMTLETGWLKFAGLQTWNRLRRVSVLGDYKTENNASLSLAYDYTPTYVNTLTFETSTVITTPGAYQWRARAPRQVMQAVRFKLTDAPQGNATTPINTGESYNLAGLTLEWATKGGIARQPDNKSK